MPTASIRPGAIGAARRVAALLSGTRRARRPSGPPVQRGQQADDGREADRVRVAEGDEEIVESGSWRSAYSSVNNIRRPAVSEKRMALTPNGKIRYLLKTPYRDGTTHVIFEPLDFIARQRGRMPRLVVAC